MADRARVMNSSQRFGFLVGLGAYFIWGSLPLYIRAMRHVLPQELLAHRVIWSVPTALILILIADNWHDVRAAFRWNTAKWLILSGLLIGLNWGVYIWAVNAGRTIEASLGYFINPLVSVLFGMLFFSEKLRPAQWVAVAVATTGVGIVTLAYGHVPWVALFLCFSFAGYGAIRKKVAIDSRAGFLMEVIVLVPLAAAWLIWFVQQPNGRPMGEGGWDVLLLMASGPITAFPLILFGLAAKRLKLSTIGMMQYIGPTIQFLIAVFVFREPFGSTHAIAFAFIWAALAVFTVDSMVGEAKARRLARSARPA
ncbi:MAG TPA: EamA family transporter RarD [Hyphomonas sp.]|nr:EamA family transporter RarD [Hyphomonas sp.]